MTATARTGARTGANDPDRTGANDPDRTGANLRAQYPVPSDDDEWAALATEGIERIEIDCPHHAMLNEPHVRTVVTELRRCFDAVDP